MTEINTHADLVDNQLQGANVTTADGTFLKTQKARGWVFTYFPLHHVLECPPFKLSGAEFQSGQYEMCPSTHRLHWQGCVYFHGPLTFESVLNKFPVREDGKRGVYLAKMKGTLKQAYDYTKKNDPWHATVAGEVRWQEGKEPEGQAALRKKTKEKESYKLLLAIKEGATLPEITMAFPTFALKSLNNIEKLIEIHGPKFEYELPERLYEWQRQLILYLCTKPDDRKIVWLYDPKGGCGKSTVIRYALTKMNAIVLSGRIQDMSHAYQGQPLVFFDITRTQESNMDHLYIMAEQLKNGMLASPKYQSTMKKFKPPHVVFMSNNPPDTTKWTGDRLHLQQLSSPDLMNLAFLGLEAMPAFHPPVVTSEELIFPDIYAQLDEPPALAVGAGEGHIENQEEQAQANAVAQNDD